ncbi:hypothetical protein K458DRAFT_417960 [Lentithecium fluviatile CBS 122367]|uniref:Uncharacterized protein n=1 Tax=Lentithecium fluviatile CBS 122367 TaxID=1168545 RepID=A0A6G1J1I1_9PLEO|nr:hypothetical protein K458DRAFT_417960 [Lentithecium fluviatile CBS 122367]
MPQLLSPRLPGVAVLRPEATGPEYTRWKRGVKSAFVAKGTWGHCDGTQPMPMPEAGPNFFSPASSPTNPQPQLLEERRAWVKKDRDVKLDIFLSVADDIKLEIFEVGPPLPPSALNAQQMLAALDERFGTFKFEEYHHVFCHFLNLHIDQYSNIEEFNAEFQATLEDLLDHGHPMSNIQACSAYFSKLRCTQNPWVAAKLKEWDAQGSELQLADLMRESPPWSIIRPLTMSSKPASDTVPDSIPEESLEDTPAHSDGEDTPSEHSEVATLSSRSSHSRNPSESTQKSQEITVHASYEDLTELQAFPTVPTTILTAAAISKRASDVSKFALEPLPPINRPLPPIPSKAATTPATRARSTSPIQAKRPSSPKTSLDLPTGISARSNTSLTLEMTHPVLRPSTPTPGTPPPSFLAAASSPALGQSQSDIHPALRNASPTPTQGPFPGTPTIATSAASPTTHIFSAMRARTPSPKMLQGQFLTPKKISIHQTSSTPDLHQRLVETTHTTVYTPSTSSENLTTPLSSSPQPPPQTKSLLRVESSSSSVLSLPLQGAMMPEYKDTTITVTNTDAEADAEKNRESEEEKKEKEPKNAVMSKIEAAKARFEGLGGSPPRNLAVAALSEEDRKGRKRSWSIKARLSARHGVKEII